MDIYNEECLHDDVNLFSIRKSPVIPCNFFQRYYPGAFIIFAIQNVYFV